MISIDHVKERKLGQWALAYLAGGWLGVQVTTVVGDRFGWPEWLMRGLIIVYGLGFFVTLVLAWYHGEKGAQRVSGMELAILSALLFIGGLGVMVVGDGSAPGPEVEVAGLTSDMGGDAPQASRAGRTIVPVAKATIAVIPFANMSSDPEQAYFSDGLTEELMDALGRIPGLQVAGRTSSFMFKDKEVPADSVGRALRVAHVLDGSVRKAGTRVRISAQLIDVRTGYRIWSERYDRELADVFAVQGEIGMAIAEALRIHVGGERAAARVAPVEVDPEAHLLVLQALQLKRDQTAGSYAEAVRLLEAALERSPDYARAYAELASVVNGQAFSRFVPPDSGYAAARVAARRAIALDPLEGRAYAILGIIAESHDWALSEAERLYRQSLEINPNDAIALANYGYLLARLGRKEEAVQVAERAVELDPLSAGRAVMLGAVYQMCGEVGRAVEPLKAAAALAPESAPVLANLALGLSQAGRHAEAVETADRAYALDRGVLSLLARAYANARAGRMAPAREAAAALRATPGVPLYLLAYVRMSFGDREGALNYLEQAVEAREDYAAVVAVDPVFLPLHSDDRMAALIRRVRSYGPS